MPKKYHPQLSLFGNEKNLVTLEEYRAQHAQEKSPARKQHEKKLMSDIIRIAKGMGLPCLHIEYFCGHRFYPRCSCGGRAVCDTCGKPVLAQCLNTINKGLAGYPDIIGIAWTIETKHKTNKKKPQEPELQTNQETKREYLQEWGIPALVINEDSADEVIRFLTQRVKK